MVETWWDLSFGHIKPVHVERATDKSIWIKGRREARTTTWNRYFPTWEEAHAHLLAECTGGVERAQRSLQSAKLLLAKVKEMRPPGTNE